MEKIGYKMTLSGQSIRAKYNTAIEPLVERTVFNGLSYGLSSAGYDIRLAEEVYLPPGEFKLASSVERFNMPLDLIAVVYDKSTLVRLGLTVQNTVVEPGWRGYLTLELANHRPYLRTLVYYIRLKINAHWQCLVAHYRWHKAIIFSNIVGKKPKCTDMLSWRERWTLKKGTPIAQVLFHQLDQPVEHPYNGKYQDQPAGPQEAIKEEPK